MRDIDLAFGHHLHQVPITELVRDIPTDTEDDDSAIEMAATEPGWWELVHAAHYQSTITFAPEPPKGLKGGSPQIYWFNNAWHAYFTGVFDKNHPDVEPNPQEKRCVLHAVSTLFEPLNFKIVDAPLCAPNKQYSLIDASVFLDPKKHTPLGLLYKADLHAANVGKSFIALQGIGSDGSLVRDPRQDLSILKITEGSWEELSIEAPTLVFKNSYYYLFYSGSAFSTDRYGVGVARSPELFGPYKKFEHNPILSGLKDDTLCGVGHQDVVQTPSGAWAIFYHVYNNQQCTGKDRYLMSDDLGWDGTDRFGTGWPQVPGGKPTKVFL